MASDPATAPQTILFALTVLRKLDLYWLLLVLDIQELTSLSP